MLMELSVPCNWDEDLLNNLGSYPVYSIYGKLDRDIIGGGRPSYALPRADKKKVERFIKKAHSMGINFTYLLNSSCLGNEEYTKRGWEKISNFLEWLQNINVDSVTVVAPYLVDLINQNFLHSLNESSAQQIKDFLISNLLVSDISLPNNQLDGFIKYFEEGNCDHFCENCNYCDRWAKKLFDKTPERFSKNRNKLEKILERIVSGDEW